MARLFDAAVQRVRGSDFAEQARSEVIVEMTMTNIRSAAAVLDAYLADGRFIVSDALTMDDIDLDIAAPFSQHTRTGAPFDASPNPMAWQQRLLDTVPA